MIFIQATEPIQWLPLDLRLQSSDHQCSVESSRIKIARNRLAELHYLLQEIYFSTKTLNIT